MKNFAKYVFVAVSIAAFMIVAVPTAEADWVPITGSARSSVTDGKSGHFEIIDNFIYALGKTGGGVFKWNKSITDPNPSSGSWESVTGGGGTDVFKKGPDGKFYVLGENGGVFRWDGGSPGWALVTGDGARTSTLNSNHSGHFEIIDNFIYALGQVGNIARWNKSIADPNPLSGGWENIVNTGAVDVFKKSPDGKFYALTQNGAVRRWEGSAWTQITGDGARTTDNFGKSGHFEIISETGGDFIYALGQLGSIARWNKSITDSNPLSGGWVNIVDTGAVDVFKKSPDGKFYALTQNGAVFRWDAAATGFTLTVTPLGTGSGTVTSPVGINCGTDCSEPYANNTPVTLTATPASGSTFAGWGGDCSGTGTCQLTMNAVKNVTAKFNTSGGDNTPPFGFIDVPAGNATVSGTAYEVVGWVLDREDVSIPNSSIKFLVDGNEVAMTSVSRSFRTDVCVAFPTVAHCAASNPGVSFKWNTSTLTTNGSHSIELSATDSGTPPLTATIGVRVVQVTGIGGTDTQPPTQPANLLATSITSTSVSLSWGASTDNVGVTGYKIYRCQGESCTPTTQIATTPTSPYASTALSPNTDYWFAVAAYDAVGNTSPQAAILVRTLPTTPPSINTLTPNQGPPSVSVTINGSGFTPPPAVNTVNFNGTTIQAGFVQPGGGSAPVLFFAVPSSATPGAKNVSVINSNGTSNTLPFTVTGTGGGNQPPVANAGTAHTNLPVGIAHTHSGATATDVEGLASYRWEWWTSTLCPSNGCPLLSNASGTLSGTSPSISGPTYIATQPGDYSLKLIVTDTGGLTAEARLNEVVIPTGEGDPCVGATGAIANLCQQIASLTAQINALLAQLGGSGLAPLAIGDLIRVSNDIVCSGNAGGLNIRQTANGALTGKKACSGDTGEIIGGPQIEQGFRWWRINWDKSDLPDGWSAQGPTGDSWLEKIPAGGGGAVQLFMDPDGPGPIQPATGIVKSKLFTLSTGPRLNEVYVDGRINIAIENGGEMIAYLKWQAPAGASCTLREDFPSIVLVNPVSFSFPLTGTGNTEIATFVIGKADLAPPNIGVNTLFTLQCGSSGSATVTASYDSFSRAGYNMTINETLAAGYTLLASKSGSPVKVDLKAAVAGRILQPPTAYTFTDGPGNPLDCQPTIGGGENCKSVVFWSAMNATSCSITKEGPGFPPDTDSREAGTFALHRDDNRWSKKFTLTCHNSSGNTDSDLVTIQ